MNLRRHWLIRIFVLLFGLQTAVTALPSLTANAVGMFGEIKAVYATDENEAEEKSVVQSNQSVRVKGSNFFNIWFYATAVVALLVYCIYGRRLPKFATPVSRQVRMNH